MTLAYLDTETTGLSPSVHDVWEMAVAIDDGPIESRLLIHDLVAADPEALEMNDYYRRVFKEENYDYKEATRWEVQQKRRLNGVTIVGANPAFDASFLSERWSVSPWHHRLLDIEVYAHGVLRTDRILGLREIAHRMQDNGYDVPDPDHTAAGDVRTLRAAHRALLHHRSRMTFLLPILGRPKCDY